MQRWLRGVLIAIRRLMLVLVLIALAWVASNGPWADASPQPVPAELALQPVRVAAARNAFVDLQGLDAPDGEDINAVGQAVLRGAQADRVSRLNWPSSPRWKCRPTEQDCVALWRSQADELRAELAGMIVLGQRCERLASAEAFEEIPIERPSSGPLASVGWAALPLPRFMNHTNCIRWLAMQAALETDPVRAQLRLAQADRLARLMLQGSRSLIGTMIGVVAVQNSWLFAAQRISAGDLERTVLTPLLAPLAVDALSPRQWAPGEARFGRELMRDLGDKVRGCSAATGESDPQPLLSLEWVMCHLRLGVLPEQSAQDIDAGWLARLAAVPPSGPADCNSLQTPLWREQEGRWPRWRNTLIRLSLDGPGVDWSMYAARQLDLELLRQTLLALNLGQPAPPGVTLQREAGGQSFSACRARLQPGEKAAVLRLPLL